MYTEQQLVDLTKNDRQNKEVDIIDNVSILHDNTIIILVSVVKSKGKIVNRNQL